jgi:hypothetical protein
MEALLQGGGAGGQVRDGVMSSQEAQHVIPHARWPDAQLIMVCGMRGMGKTYFMEHYVAAGEPRVFVIAARDEGFPRVRRRLDWRQSLEEMEAGGPLWRKYVIPKEVPSAEFAEEFFEAALVQLEDCLIVIEEAPHLIENPDIRRSPLERIILQGRNDGVRIMAGAQRLNRLPTAMRSEATEIVMFRAKFPEDLDIYRSWGFDDAREVGPHLGRGQCYVITRE